MPSKSSVSSLLTHDTPTKTDSEAPKSKSQPQLLALTRENSCLIIILITLAGITNHVYIKCMSKFHS